MGEDINNDDDCAGDNGYVDHLTTSNNGTIFQVLEDSTSSRCLENTTNQLLYTNSFASCYSCCVSGQLFSLDDLNLDKNKRVEMISHFDT